MYGKIRGVDCLCSRADRSLLLSAMPPTPMRLLKRLDLSRIGCPLTADQTRRLYTAAARTPSLSAAMAVCHVPSRLAAWKRMPGYGSPLLRPLP
ncbi:MAG: hypothetical protein ACLR0U_01580 [Enterocloster clostridioformis]